MDDLIECGCVSLCCNFCVFVCLSLRISFCVCCLIFMVFPIAFYLSLRVHLLGGLCLASLCVSVSVCVSL